MKITIAARHRPYSHQPGTKALIPRGPYTLQAFPTLIRLFEGDALLYERKLPFSGPVKNFTLMQDLEKGILKFFGHAKEGYFSYEVAHKGALVEFKGNRESFTFDVTHKPLPKQEVERLSLGSHKAQEFELMARRLDLKEILPLWFHLGQITPVQPIAKIEGTLALLKPPSGKNEILATFSHLFLAGFDSLFSPKINDDRYLGLSPWCEETKEVSALPLLTEGAKLIRSLFFKNEDNHFEFLPLLPHYFPSGRFINIKAEGATIDFEWTERRIRKVMIHPHKAGDLVLSFPKEIKSFRLNKKGRLETNLPLKVESGITLFLDRFEK